MHQKARKSYNDVGHAHELTFGCFKGMPLLDNDHARRTFLEELNQARTVWKFQVWAYVIMPNHVHLLVWPTEEKYSISLIRKAIKQPVSQRLIAEWRLKDPERLTSLVAGTKRGQPLYAFWQAGGGYDRNMHSNQSIRNAIEYIHMNPVRKGLVASSLDWEWSSARQYHGEGLVKFVVDFPK